MRSLQSSDGDKNINEISAALAARSWDDGATE